MNSNSHRRYALAAALSALAWPSWNTSLVRADTFLVNDTSDVVDGNPGDGVCETTAGSAICTLRAAIQEANALAALAGSAVSSDIEVPAGTYVLSIAGAGEDAAVSGDLDINTSLTIRGAGASSTLIDAAGLDRVFDVSPAPVAEASTLSVSLIDLTARGGQADLSGGGGILFACPLSVQRAAVRDNSSDGPGGGLSSTNLINDDPQLTLIDSVVDNNDALPFGADGGGIEAFFATAITITRSVISNNRTGGTGGGLHGGPITGSALITDSTFSGNVAGVMSSFGIGGALSAACATISGSTFSGNQSSANGGAIQNSGDCGASITNSTISGNTAGTVGGGLANSGTITLRYVTLTNNTALGPAGDAGGGIFQFGSSSNTQLENTIVGPNLPNDCDGLPISSLGHNIASDATCTLTDATDLLSTAPLLGALADNGGPTQTHALLPGSPAIDAAAAIAGITVDQRGFARPADGNADGTAASDIGAYELGGTPPRSDDPKRDRDHRKPRKSHKTHDAGCEPHEADH